MPTLFEQAQLYVGRPYESGVFDCADLAALVQRELFGCAIDLQQNRVRPRGVLGQAREIRRLQGDLADRIERPLTGCGVLMYEAGLDSFWHIGTVFLDGDDLPWVLHNSAKLGGAALQRLADLVRWGLKLDGYYAWKNVQVAA